MRIFKRKKEDLHDCKWHANAKCALKDPTPLDCAGCLINSIAMDAIKTHRLLGSANIPLGIAFDIHQSLLKYRKDIESLWQMVNKEYAKDVPAIQFLDEAKGELKKYVS